MSEQAELVLRNRNPDVLTCIANLSNDEVFTPPEIANQMLDMVAGAWAEAHEGANLWEDGSVRFLDPFTKSGVFLREIVTRLTAGLEEAIPDLQERVNHILTEQVFGIALTNLTSLLARRSVYCSKWANGEHSIATAFDAPDGNVWFERTEHTWEGGTPVRGVDPLTGEETITYEGGRCKWCSAPRGIFEREDVLENHAYKFIHGDDPLKIIAEVFGDEMQFDVVIGNPPYQMTGGGGGTNDSSIYQHFVQQAIKLQPRFLSMVVPARWMAGGRGLDEFRKMMLGEGHLRNLVDYPDSGEAFPGVQIKGGVCYFLWDSTHIGTCDVTRVASGQTHAQAPRDLGEFDVLLRDERAVGILRKVLTKAEASVLDLLSGDTPFGIATNFAGYTTTRAPGDVELHLIERSRRTTAWMPRASIRKNAEAIDRWKVLLPKAYGAGESYPHQILGKEIVAGPGSVCTQTYMIAWPFESRSEAESFASYYRTRFFRFLVSLRKITQDALRSTYSWVPQQTWDRAWTDEMLYAKYGITEDEAAFIEAMVRPMEGAVE